MKPYHPSMLNRLGIFTATVFYFLQVTASLQAGGLLRTTAVCTSALIQIWEAQRLIGSSHTDLAAKSALQTGILPQLIAQENSAKRRAELTGLQAFLKQPTNDPVYVWEISGAQNIAHFLKEVHKNALYWTRLDAGPFGTSNPRSFYRICGLGAWSFLTCLGLKTGQPLFGFLVGSALALFTGADSLRFMNLTVVSPQTYLEREAHQPFSLYEVRNAHANELLIVSALAGKDPLQLKDPVCLFENEYPPLVVSLFKSGLTAVTNLHIPAYSKVGFELKLFRTNPDQLFVIFQTTSKKKFDEWLPSVSWALKTQTAD